jgi:hypothetical protein
VEWGGVQASLMKPLPQALEQIPITLKRTLLRRSSWRILVV